MLRRRARSKRCAFHFISVAQDIMNSTTELDEASRCETRGHTTIMGVVKVTTRDTRPYHNRHAYN